MSRISGNKVLPGALPRDGHTVAIITGGAAGNHTVTGIKTTDKLLAVNRLTGAPTDVTDKVALLSEFTISAADTINNTGGTDTTGSKLEVLYQKAAS